MEVWKDIPNWPGYQASSLGNIRSFWKAGNRRGKPPELTKSSRILKPYLEKKQKYCKTSLSKDGVATSFRVHVLIALAFLGNPPKGQEVRHKNNIRHDNRIDNLEYGTRQENMLDKHKHGTQFRGSTHPNSKLDESDVYMLRLCLKNKLTTVEISSIFKVSQTLVTAIDKERIWKHVRI